MAEQWLDLNTLGRERSGPDDAGRAFLATLPSARPSSGDPDQAFLSELPDQSNTVFMDAEKVQRGRALAATLNVPFSSVFDSVDQVSKSFDERDPGWFKTASNSFKRGWGNVYVSAARAAEWAGLPKSITNTYLEFGERLRDAYMPPMKPEEFTFDKLLDSRWWATTGVESVPSMLSLVPAAIVGAYAGSAGAAAAGLGAFGKVILGSIGATALSRPIESAFEAGGSYEEALAQGQSEAVAKERASFVFSRNMALGAVDVAQLATAFTPFRLMGANASSVLARRVASALGRIGGVGLMEAGEEAYQAGIQQLARGERMSWNAEMKEGAALGLVFGVGTGVGGSVFTTLTGRLENKMPPNLSEEFQANENAAQVAGLSAEDAKLKAFDMLAETPGGQTFIEKEMGDLVDIAEGKEPPQLTPQDMEAAIETVAEEQEFTADEEQAEPEPLAGILTDEDIDAIGSGEATIEQALGMEEEIGPSFIISDETYQSALASLKEKTRGLHAGIDPTVLADLAKIGAYHIERGVRDFAAWSKAMIEKAGEAIRPHLQDIWDAAWEQMPDRARAQVAKKAGERIIEKVEEVEGATVPTSDVKKQIRRTTGQEILVKMIREDQALAAAFKKAEQASRAAYKAGGKDATEKAKAQFRDVLIKAKAKAEMFGFREGFKVSEKLTRKEFIAAFQEKQAMTKATQKMLIGYINENLPANMRGRFLESIINAASEPKAFSMMSQVDDLKEKLTRKELIAELKDLQEYKGRSIAVEYQRKIQDLVGDIDTKQFGRQMLLKLSGLIDYAEENGMPSGVSPRIREQLARLEQKNVADMTTDELQALVDLANHLKELGKLKLQLKYKYDQREREKARAALVASTRNIDPKLTGQNTQADKLKAGALYAYLETLPGQRVPELLDNYRDGANVQLFKELWNAEQAAHWDKKTTLEAAAEEMMALGITELTDEQQVKIMINIRNQEGADAATLTLMEKFGYQEIPDLTPQEQGLINILKKYSNRDVDKIAALYEETNNEPFVKLPDRILPLKYEGETYVSAEEALLHDHNRTTQAQQGFTQSRKPGVKKIPRVDVLGVFELGLDEQKWYIHVQPILDDAARLVKTREYIDAAGAAGANWWADHLDIMARRGWSASAHYSPFNAVLKQARGNLTKAILGYRLSTILMQPFAVIDAMAYAQSRWGATAALQVAKEFTKSWIAPHRSRDIVNQSQKLIMRTGGEFAIQEALTQARAQQSFKNKFIARGMSLMMKADQVTAAGVQQGIKKVLEAQGIEGAAHEAEQLTDMVSSSSDVSFRPHVLSRGEMARTWFTFGTFFLNRWAVIAHDLIAKGVVRGNWRMKANAMLGLAIIVAGKIAEDEARKYLYEMVSGKEAKDRSLLERLLFSLPENIPIFGNVFDSFSGGSGADIPLVKVIGDLLGAHRAITSEKPEAKARALLRGAEAGLALGAGVPGTSQAFDVIERIFLPTGKTGKTERVELAN